MEIEVGKYYKLNKNACDIILKLIEDNTNEPITSINFLPDGDGPWNLVGSEREETINFYKEMFDALTSGGNNNYDKDFFKGLGFCIEECDEGYEINLDYVFDDKEDKMVNTKPTLDNVMKAFNRFLK